MAVVSTAEKAYFAAVIDVLGRIRVRKFRDAELPEVAVSSANLPLLQHLGEMTGVRVYETERQYSRHNCNEHCPAAHQGLSSTSAVWKLSGAKATVLLANVLPHLRLKSDDATQAILLGLEAGYKRATVDKMAQLGWDVAVFTEPG